MFPILGQAAVRHVVGDEQLLLLLVEVGDDGEKVRVGEPPQPPHVLREVPRPTPFISLNRFTTRALRLYADAKMR